MREKITISNAKWIWCEDNTKKNDFVVFRRTFTLKELVPQCVCTISAETKYWLWVNGQLAVFEGGLFRESMPGCGYADQIDISPWLQTGENVVAVLCWYYGNGGRNNVNSGQAGFLFACDKLNLYSGPSFLCVRHPAFYTPGALSPAYLYGGDNIGFDARQDLGDFTSMSFDEGEMQPAVTYPNQVWGNLYLRPIPLHRREELDQVCVESVEDHYVLNLPHASQCVPYFKVEAKGGEVITICTDHYTINGGPGDEVNQYNSHRLEYRCKPGVNIVDGLFYLFGEQLIFCADHPVKFCEVGYRNTGYDSDIIGSFTCDCPITNRLMEKAAHTLYCCMRDNFMDCPDRERGQWIGDVSVQAPQTFYLMDEKAQLLLKKCIMDFICLRKGDVLVGNVPGEHFSELPSQSLNAISEYGLVAQYYRFTEDRDILKVVFEPAVRYLMLWELGKDGLLIPRTGNWYWFDHLYNADEPVLENAWYCSALRFARQMADVVDDHRFDGFLSERFESLNAHFNARFWQGDSYRSGNFVDDRANAMAVLAGFADKAQYPAIRKVLLSVSNATVYMENYVLTALCEMGYVEDAYHRMVSRYYNLAQNDNSTLWEDFYILGTKNHAWSGGPATIAFRYFMGIKTQHGLEQIIIRPQKNLFRKMHCCMPAKNGIIKIDADCEAESCMVENCSDSHVDCRFEESFDNNCI